MKILFVNRFLCPKGGIETYIKQLGEYLAEQGHVVEFFGCDGENRWLSNSWGVYVNAGHKDGLINSVRTNLSFIYSKEAARKIRTILQEFKPDVVHLNNFEHYLTPSIILEIAKWRKQNHPCALVATAHSYDFVCPNHTCYNFRTNQICEKCLSGNYWHSVIENCMNSNRKRMMIYAVSAYYWRYVRHVYSKIDRVVCCSGFMKRKIDSHPQLAPKSIVLQNYINQSLIPGKKQKEEYVLYFGRYAPEKGIRTLLSVCRQLSHIQFVFAGHGELCHEMKDIMNVSDVGFLHGDDLNNLISNALFSVYPSEWYENSPFSILESIRLGTPVIASDIGGIPELILDDYNGRLFESGNASALKHEIESLFIDRERLVRYTKNCALSCFTSIDNYAETMMSVYEDAIRDHQP